MAADEIERFRREIIERTGDPRAADNITDKELLREVINTVGKPGQLGAKVRCVVSVAMLTEGWDASNVTHILGSFVSFCVPGLPSLHLHPYVHEFSPGRIRFHRVMIVFHLSQSSRSLGPQAYQTNRQHFL